MARVATSSKCARIFDSPPLFLAPSLAQKSLTKTSFAAFSTSTAQWQRTRDNNRVRGVSALRRTGPKRHLEMSKLPLPEPVLDPERKSKVVVDKDHGLWEFFATKDSPMMTPEETAQHGRAWTVKELRHKDWNDLHCLWWTCVKQLNMIATQEYERERLKAGYGALENMNRTKAIRSTMKAIKHTLTERWYAWEDARKLAKKEYPELRWEGGGGLFHEEQTNLEDGDQQPKNAKSISRTTPKKTSLASGIDLNPQTDAKGSPTSQAVNETSPRR